MPRAATAIIAIACSATYLSGDAGSGPALTSRCLPKSKRGRALSKKAASKQSFISQYEATDDEQDGQDATILAHLASDPGFEDHWTTARTNIDAIGDVLEVGAAAVAEEILLQTLAWPLPKVGEARAATALSALPEELLIQTLAYVGVCGRAVCRAGRRCYDSSVKGVAEVPTFPVKVCVKQHCHFGEQPVTTTWEFDVAAPTTPSSLQFCIESGSEQQDFVLQRSEQSGQQVLGLCRELRALQTHLGVHHKEGGRTQVEVFAKDAVGRTLLDHAYEHRIFCSKADDLLELLTESESQPMRKPIVCTQDSGNDTPLARTNIAARDCTGTCAGGRFSRTRPVSRARD